jgi:ketosteroid isomerase-like protein
MPAELTMQDRLELHELIARYAHLLDLGGTDRLGEIYTEDARFVVAALDVDIQGLPALIEFFGVTMAQMSSVRHVITNIFTDATGNDTADLHAYLQIVDGAAKAITTVGVYHDNCVRTPAGWRVAVRTVRMS